MLVSWKLSHCTKQGTTYLCPFILVIIIHVAVISYGMVNCVEFGNAHDNHEACPKILVYALRNAFPLQQKPAVPPKSWEEGQEYEMKVPQSLGEGCWRSADIQTICSYCHSKYPSHPIFSWYTYIIPVYIYIALFDSILSNFWSRVICQ